MLIMLIILILLILNGAPILYQLILSWVLPLFCRCCQASQALTPELGSLRSRMPSALRPPPRGLQIYPQYLPEDSSEKNIPSIQLESLNEKKLEAQGEDIDRMAQDVPKSESREYRSRRGNATRHQLDIYFRKNWEKYGTYDDAKKSTSKYLNRPNFLNDAVQLTCPY